MNTIEQLIYELQESSCELYHKNRTQKQQKELVISMLHDCTTLQRLLNDEYKVLKETDAY